jgi:hypothetical protein
VRGISLDSSNIGCVSLALSAYKVAGIPLFIGLVVPRGPDRMVEQMKRWQEYSCKVANTKAKRWEEGERSALGRVGREGGRNRTVYFLESTVPTAQAGCCGLSDEKGVL